MTGVRSQKRVMIFEFVVYSTADGANFVSKVLNSNALLYIIFRRVYR